MPVNAHPDYIAAENRYLEAETPEAQIEALEEMLEKAPKHKSSEKLLANLKTRYKKLLEKLNKGKKARKGNRVGIKKGEMQAVIIGKTNSGKSSILNLLTNASPEITKFSFSTKEPQIGMMNYADTQIQIIENPSVESEFYDKGLTNSAEVLIIVTTNLEDIPYLEETSKKSIC